jgi:hypothetical protein
MTDQLATKGSASSASVAPILEIRTENSSDLVRNMATDVGPLQFVREFSLNGIEAVRMLGDGARGQIVWDVDWALVEQSNGRKRKLSIIDTGIGMSGPQMLRFLNSLASSGKSIGRGKNKGVGAKISGAAVSPAGVVYRSWHAGAGAEVIFQRHGSDEDAPWGLLPLRDDAEGEDNYFRPLSNEGDKPYLLRKLKLDHGTQITLMGQDDLDDTTVAPPAVLEGKQRWLIRSLNMRFFRLPDDVEVLVREGNEIKEGSWKPGELHRAYGTAHFLSDPERTVASGSVDLGNATAHWWLLSDDRKARGRESGEWCSAGHVAALWHDELYEVRETTHGGYARLQEFGIRLGYERVVLYVEPRIEGVDSDTARTRLRMPTGGQNDDLPWSQWASRFRRKMPAEIAALMKQIAMASSEDTGRGYAKRIIKHVELFALRAHRKERVETPAPRAGGPSEATSAPNGSEPPSHVTLAQELTAIGGAEAGLVTVAVEAEQTVSEPRSTDESASSADAAPIETSDGGASAAAEPARPVDPEAVAARQREALLKALTAWIPEVLWISAEDGTRPPGDLEDLAARWERGTNTLTINADFRSYKDLEADAMEEFDATHGADVLVVAGVREVYAQQLVEAVVHARALEGSGRWSRDRVDSELLTPGALTAVVGNRVLLWLDLRKRLGQRLGARSKAA